MRVNINLQVLPVRGTTRTSEAVAARRSSPSLHPAHRTGSAHAAFCRHSDPVVALTPKPTSFPQDLGEEDTYGQTREEVAGSSSLLVALGTSANPTELRLPQQSRQTCLASLFQSGQNQNTSEVLMLVESARSPGSQLPENLVSQPLP